MSLRSLERTKWERRARRAFHVRHRVVGTPERPRLTVYRSNRHFHCQIIEDVSGRTLVSASTQQEAVIGDLKHGGDTKAAVKVGERIATLAKEKGIAQVVFDRNFYKFHGRVRAFAEAASKGGLKFLQSADPKKQNKVKKEKPAKSEGKPASAKKEKQPKKEQKPAGAAAPAQETKG